ncbi:MAG: DUF2202 domain-containing protein [Flavobacteriales bacterium]|nr:DUF2202 domain-containing protein [Flavobacteriia bacterium]NCP06497.1 DUF2202 domain-containing protein [Flavobacteriales bacterium]PIV93829.1 MAG: hypothetical protein COW44_07395 [Flavobacteriaceae bacterium CG17_big_fil_post_rev_8_21_14_2_50_33_15]PIY11270.1 MAG: hypothetical protein COZ17_07120 [Flavobacteriaceae bacterium CG_4_10_14_3_um_filter_33_47]PJB20623.1 MAG: hypothetical protein CO117_00205 [Flavobacteriaceae bacterium CG_4_9_14_3_um_filter_33_16]
MKPVINKLVIILISTIPFNFYGQSANLSNQEIIDLKYMLEEEKVAHDVYDYLDKKWHLKIFGNIKQSEQRHMEMVEYLLNSYKVSYQFSDEQGMFYNEHLQNMYNDLIEKGSKSEFDALEVGKMIEVVDIEDLEKALKKTTNSDISQVYSTLIFASNNHLRAFNRNLSRFN